MAYRIPIRKSCNFILGDFLSTNGKLFALSLKGSFIEKTFDGWKIQLSPRSPQYIPEEVGYYEDEKKTIFILTDEFKLLEFLRRRFEFQNFYH